MSDKPNTTSGPVKRYASRRARDASIRQTLAQGVKSGKVSKGAAEAATQATLRGKAAVKDMRKRFEARASLTGGKRLPPIKGRS